MPFLVTTYFGAGLALRLLPFEPGTPLSSYLAKFADSLPMPSTSEALLFSIPPITLVFVSAWLLSICLSASPSHRRDLCDLGYLSVGTFFWGIAGWFVAASVIGSISLPPATPSDAVFFIPTEPQSSWMPTRFEVFQGLLAGVSYGLGFLPYGLGLRVMTIGVRDVKGAGFPARRAASHGRLLAVAWYNGLLALLLVLLALEVELLRKQPAA
jgi:hypothetical protein